MGGIQFNNYAGVHPVNAFIPSNIDVSQHCTFPPIAAISVFNPTQPTIPYHSANNGVSACNCCFGIPEVAPGEFSPCQPLERPMQYEPMKAAQPIKAARPSVPSGTYYQCPPLNVDRPPTMPAQTWNVCPPKAYQPTPPQDLLTAPSTTWIIVTPGPEPVAKLCLDNSGSALVRLAASFVDDLVSRRVGIMTNGKPSNSSPVKGRNGVSPKSSTNVYGAIGSEVEMRRSQSSNPPTPGEGICAKNEVEGLPASKQYRTTQTMINHLTVSLRLSRIVILVALFLADKAISKGHTGKFLERSNTLFLSCIILASKQLDDNSYRNATFAKSAGFTLLEVVEMERELLVALDYCVNVDVAGWMAFVSGISFRFAHTQAERECLEEVVMSTLSRQQESMPVPYETSSQACGYFNSFPTVSYDSYTYLPFQNMASIQA